MKLLLTFLLASAPTNRKSFSRSVSSLDFDCRKLGDWLLRLVQRQVASREVLAGTKIPRGEWGKELYMLDLFMTNVRLVYDQC